MIFDTDAKSINNLKDYRSYSELIYKELIQNFPKKIGYYSKYPFENSFFVEKLNEKDSFLAGLGVDHHESMDKWFSKIKSGFIQGNFNQESLAKDFDNFRKDFDSYINQLVDINEVDRVGWVCGLGHGILKNTPEENVRYFIENIRKVFS
tara:strand:- start:274 stop:723 length:450 start_codon:yes stop_codon:yes gene_type:complete